MPPSTVREETDPKRNPGMYNVRETVNFPVAPRIEVIRELLEGRETPRFLG